MNQPTRPTQSPFPLIGLAGLAGVGKDTAADYLCGLGLARFSFATPLKALLADLLDVTLGQLDRLDKTEPRDELGGKTLRYAMQTLGTEWGRNTIGRELWVSRANRHYQEQSELFLAGHTPVRGLVVTDIRFNNEADWIRTTGGILIHIHRPGFSPDIVGHPSEHGVQFDPDFDRRFTNDGDIADLGLQLRHILATSRASHLLARTWQPLAVKEGA